MFCFSKLKPQNKNRKQNKNQQNSPNLSLTFGNDVDKLPTGFSFSVNTISKGKQYIIINIRQKYNTFLKKQKK